MAKFDIAFNKVILSEGGYVNDKDDKGGETFMGIARKYHKSSIIWKIIDAYKELDGINNLTKILKNDVAIIKAVKAIYKNEYWDKLNLDDCNKQDIANQIFDTSVNMGINKAIRLAQKTFNLPQNGKVTDDLLKRINEL